jgi:hypothetical protein
VGVGEMKEIGVLLHVTLLGKMMVCWYVVLAWEKRKLEEWVTEFFLN